MPDTDVIRWGEERVRTGPWRGDRHVAYVSPLPDAPVPSAAFVRRCCDLLAVRGYTRVVTAALSEPEQRGFLAAGFTVEEQLHLLAHDLEGLPPPTDAEQFLRRAKPLDRPEVLRVDEAAFPQFWRLDLSGLDEALRATPHARFRVAAVPEVVGYAVTGRAARRGFLQRLAVQPDRQRAGLGRALVLDGLRWLRRWRAERAVVNTQLENDAALALYESLGFRREPSGLSVLGVGLTA
ncbi:MAG TPA: GNAT family N-acetyltransferase [Acidimicrobiales bacterium]|nr:GNAT family N-acetyltransferase [Acidimicrobiales bacterium]